MAETMIIIPPFPFILFLLISLHHIIANGVHSFEEKQALILRDLHHQLSTTPSCLQPQLRRERDVVVLEMKDTSHCSKKKVHSRNQRLEKQLALDEHRVHSIQNRIQKMMSTHHDHDELDIMEAEIPLILGNEFQILNYVVNIGLGSHNMTVIVDTGSDLTWVQCEPCMSCYDQKGPLFNPSASPSYQSVLCNSSTCQSLNNSTLACVNNTSICGYGVRYLDESYTIGELGVENLSFGDISVSNFVFGCGLNNKGISFGKTSGILGLGRGSLSMISQTDAVFGGVFSYCLPTIDLGASGSLVMGDVIVETESSIFKNITPITYTRMLHNPQLSNSYVVNLTKIDIGGVALEASSFGNGRVIIDSGTVITRLAPPIYSAVKEEFLKQFPSLPLASNFSILDTCFDLSEYEQEINVPTMRMHFEGNAKLEVDVYGMMIVIREDHFKVCLALASISDENEISIIGNFQQRNQRVIYDTKRSKVGFAREPCSFNT